ncbi:MAG: ribbon-helix-helix domain-containing protein [Alphaproteobacteria bacterium]|nr:ribbon-helix-helix domain-containing protein [Alphaproteobacteria bacterium]MBP7758896.1 ribbon-helix-helix domain-containing protein [Alphaproteobacteria bacterium]MBP7762170.1 ribbon-helix-helix domain-containing protein [Alphaproteobacteria bacterium]MBP7905327.1 ribbon-helix-helix domain-containing protein [Alphaproteobacteria bacterium]
MKKRSVLVSGHPTSVTLEEEFWDALRVIAERRGQSLNQIITTIDAGRRGSNLSSAIRVFVLKSVTEAAG